MTGRVFFYIKPQDIFTFDNIAATDIVENVKSNSLFVHFEKNNLLMSFYPCFEFIYRSRFQNFNCNFSNF